MGRWARVAVHLPVDGLFTYAVPEGTRPGHAVLVPFGARRATGTVVELLDAPDVEEPRAVLRVLDPEPVLDAGQLRFLSWAADYYLAGPGEMIAAALPAAYRARTRRAWRATEAGVARLAEAGAEPADLVLRELVARPGLTRAGLARRLAAELDADEVARALSALHRAGLAAFEDREPGGPGGRIAVVRLRAGADARGMRLGARMRAVLARLADAGGELPLPELVGLEGPGAREAVRRLERRGLVERDAREDRRGAEGGALRDAGPPPEPNEEQRAAIEAIASGGATTWLLHGVTGSGKTEVYLRVAARVLDAGRQVLVLVPEIALTPQLLGRFRARFGEAVAVLHSALTPAERLREWRRIRAGEARVAVGARSALFAPFPDLGLVVVDEEHDASYKQDEGVAYNARDLAVVRGRLAGCPVVLGSATPNLESWMNARTGRYRLLRLSRRATPRPPPRIEIVDMRGRPADMAISPELAQALDEALEGGGQAIVLTNRRGYAPVVECPDCGAHYECPACGIGMVLHRADRRVRCHACGFWLPWEERCRHCGGELAVLGHGTQRVEELLAERWGRFGVARMDADTVARRGAHQAVLEDFRAGRARLLVGTQLVAKGHDFPDVALAAVVGVDHLLALPDFRSAERTWALVTQLAGRAGRGERPARVLVQTRHADHFVFRHVGEEAFLEEEARVRRALGQPPFSSLVLVRVASVDREAARAHADGLVAALRAEPAPPGTDVLGPVLAPFARRMGRHRWQVLLRGRARGPFRRWLARVRPILRRHPPRGVRVRLDVDPRDLA